MEPKPSYIPDSPVLLQFLGDKPEFFNIHVDGRYVAGRRNAEWMSRVNVKEGLRYSMKWDGQNYVFVPDEEKGFYLALMTYNGSGLIPEEMELVCAPKKS